MLFWSVSDVVTQDCDPLQVTVAFGAEFTVAFPHDCMPEHVSEAPAISVNVVRPQDLSPLHTAVPPAGTVTLEGQVTLPPHSAPEQALSASQTIEETPAAIVTGRKKTNAQSSHK